MSRTPLLAGNWKMHTTIGEAIDLAKAIVAATAGLAGRQVMLAPPFTALAAVAEILKGSGIILGAQNICWAAKGAFTGEISPVMLQDLGATMAIVGHSERRHLFAETDALINRRVIGAMAHGVIPLLCIGEQLAEREAGQTLTILESQLRGSLQEVAIGDPEKLIIAYEPVWAIGTGLTATPDQAQAAHAFIRQILAELFQKSVASQIRILYGGSVNSGNIDALMGQEDIDGALVGGAALQADAFSRIVHFQ
ncbi:MAG: triose-phosphate isomerase [Desulfobulbaceae bacterium]|nr:triose-phosphate isomerase [Desulfobulbaceae bacterium]